MQCNSCIYFINILSVEITTFIKCLIDTPDISTIGTSPHPMPLSPSNGCFKRVSSNNTKALTNSLKSSLLMAGSASLHNNTE